MSSWSETWNRQNAKSMVWGYYQELSKLKRWQLIKRYKLTKVIEHWERVCANQERAR